MAWPTSCWPACRGKQVDLSSIGRALNDGSVLESSVLEGSVRTSGDYIRFAALMKQVGLPGIGLHSSRTAAQCT